MSGILYLADVPAGGLDPFELYDRVTAEIDWTNVGDFRIVVLNASGVVVRRIVTNRQEYATLGQLWRRDVMPNIMETSARPIWREGWRVVFQQPTRGRYPPAELLQRFRDGGETHCVLTPIRTYYEAKLAAAAGDATRRKCQTSLARCAQLERQFRDGVPETCLEYVARRLAVRIHLSDAFGNHERRYNNEDARNRIFKFRNVSFNHVQEMACLTEVETLSAAGMDAQLRMLKDGRSFYMYTQSGVGGVPTRIDCPLGRFALDDPDKTCFQAARDRYKLDGYAIDAQKEPLLARFLDAGLRVTSHAKFHAGEVFEDDPAEYKVIDLSRAYTRGTDAGPYFQGYLAGVGNVRRVDAGIDHLRAHPGIYSVDCIDLSGCNERLFDLATQLHLQSGTHLVLPSPELLWWWDHGVRFEIVGGAWGPVLDDIDWEGCGLLEKGTGPLFTGLSRYKVWCGQLGYSNRGRKNVYLPGDSRWAAVLANAGYHAHHYEGDGDICVRLPAAKTPELKHVFAFVTSYTRINVLNKLLEFDIQNVRGVMLDAIIYVGDDAAESDLWVRKDSIDPLVLSEYGVDGWYGTHGIWAGERADGFITAAPTAITSPLTFLEGAGGSGKSHSVLADAGFRDILFAAPTWSLVCFMMRKYGVAGTTVHRLAGTWTEIDDEGHERTIKCRPYHEERQRYPSVVFVDEATMIDAAMLKRVCDVYAGKSQIILAGDIKVSDLEADTPPVWFQCRNRTRVFDPREVGCAIVSYAHDYRASGALVDLKRALRDAMLGVFLQSTADDPGDDEFDARDVAAAARSLFASQVCTAADCEAGYAKGDTILAGTHELADEWGVKLKDRDARYRVVSHTHADVEAAQRGEDVSLTGDIVDDKGDRNAVFALAFTIHSFQGKTFTGRTLWIDARRSWDYAMLYTAISRCQIISQIRIFFE